MVIERIYGSNQVQKAHNAKKSREAKQKDAGVKNDKISISSAAQEKAVFSKALEAAKAAPDMRAERVKAAKENIEKGTYNQNPVIEKIAEKIAEILIG